MQLVIVIPPKSENIVIPLQNLQEAKAPTDQPEHGSIVSRIKLIQNILEMRRGVSSNDLERRGQQPVLDRKRIQREMDRFHLLEPAA